MATTGDVTINISADTSQLESAVRGAEQSLQQLGGAGAEGGEKASKGLQKAEKATKDAKKATDDAAKSGKEAATSFDKMGDSAGKVGSASAKMRGALDLLSPSAAEAAGLVNDLGDAGEVASQALGALGPYGRVAVAAFTGLAVIVPVVGEALMDQGVASQELQAQYASLERATVAAAEAQRAYDAALKGVKAETDVILGLKSREQVATERSVEAMRTQTQETLNANQAVIVQEALVQDKIRADIAAGNTVSDRIALEQRFATAMAESISREEKATQANRAARAELQQYIDIKDGELSSLEKEKKDREAEGKARAWQAKQAELLGKKEREAAEAKRKADADAAAFSRERSDADKTVVRLLDEKLQKEELSARQYDEQAALLKTELVLRQERGMEAVAVEEAILQAETRATEERIALAGRVAGERATAAADEAARIEKAEADSEEEQERLDELAEKEKQRRMEMASAALDIATSLSNSLLQLADREASDRESRIEKMQQQLEDGEETLTEGQKKRIRARIKEEKEAARSVFRVQQGLQMSMAAMNAAQAVLNAMANVPAPLNVPAALAAGIAGAVQVGIIATQKPKFHSGGMVYPDEGNATLLGGEAVLNRSAAESLGAQGVDALNAGKPYASSAPVIRIGRLEAREILRTDMLGGGYLVSNLSRYVSPSSSRTVFA